MKVEERLIEGSTDMNFVLVFENEEDMKMYNALVKLGKASNKTPQELVTEAVKEGLKEKNIGDRLVDC